MIREDGYSFSFIPDACASCGGACCIGESGYIWVDYKEIEAISKYLKMDIEDFAKEYLIRVKNRYSLKEFKVKELGYACIFFNTQKRVCKIYDVRPKQCKTFPFWEQFKCDTIELEKECLGVILDEKN